MFYSAPSIIDFLLSFLHIFRYNFLLFCSKYNNQLFSLIVPNIYNFFLTSISVLRSALNNTKTTLYGIFRIVLLVFYYE